MVEQGYGNVVRGVTGGMGRCSVCSEVVVRTSLQVGCLERIGQRSLYISSACREEGEAMGTLDSAKRVAQDMISHLDHDGHEPRVREGRHARLRNEVDQLVTPSKEWQRIQNTLKERHRTVRSSLARTHDLSAEDNTSSSQSVAPSVVPDPSSPEVLCCRILSEIVQRSPGDIQSASTVLLAGSFAERCRRVTPQTFSGKQDKWTDLEYVTYLCALLSHEWTPQQCGLLLKGFLRAFPSFLFAEFAQGFWLYRSAMRRTADWGMFSDRMIEDDMISGVIVGHASYYAGMSENLPALRKLVLEYVCGPGLLVCPLEGSFHGKAVFSGGLLSRRRFGADFVARHESNSPIAGMKGRVAKGESGCGRKEVIHVKLLAWQAGAILSAHEDAFDDNANWKHFLHVASVLDKFAVEAQPHVQLREKQSYIPVLEEILSFYRHICDGRESTRRQAEPAVKKIGQLLAFSTDEVDEFSENVFSKKAALQKQLTSGPSLWSNFGAFFGK